jgi:hypothetical protein
MKDAANSWVEGDGWFGQAESGVPALAGVEADSDGNVMISAESRADWNGEDRKLSDQLKLHLGPIDALTYADRIRAAAIEALEFERRKRCGHDTRERRVPRPPTDL